MEETFQPYSEKYENMKPISHTGPVIVVFTYSKHHFSFAGQKERENTTDVRH